MTNSKQYNAKGLACEIRELAKQRSEIVKLENELKGKKELLDRSQARLDRIASEISAS